MTWTVATYVAYLLAAVPLTLWVGRNLARHGQTFLESVYDGSAGLGTAVDRLLVVGFHLFGLGLVALILPTGSDVVGFRRMVEQLSVKLGVVALVLGALHLATVAVFASMRRHHRFEAYRMAHPVPAPVWFAPPVYPAPYPVQQAAHHPAPGREPVR